MTTERRRRRHAAAGARILVAGVSTSATLAMMAAMAQPERASSSPVAVVGVASPTETVVATPDRSDTARAQRVPPRVEATSAVPVTASHAS